MQHRQEPIDRHLLSPSDLGLLHPASHPERDQIRIRWPDLAVSVLREANSGLPVSFQVFINDNGAVSLSVIDTTVQAASYAPFFDALTHKLNQSFPVGNNPCLPFRLAPTDLQFAIHGLPIKAHPAGNAILCDLLEPSLFNAQSILIPKARFLNPDPGILPPRHESFFSRGGSTGR